MDAHINPFIFCGSSQWKRLEDKGRGKSSHRFGCCINYIDCISIAGALEKCNNANAFLFAILILIELRYAEIYWPK